MRLMNLVVATVLLASCGGEPVEMKEVVLPEVSPEVATAGQELATSTNAFCPAGFSFDATYRLCVSATEAVGPFTVQMINTCKANGGGSACDGGRWGVSFARSIRGTGTCMPGAVVDSSIAACVEGTNAFGVFTVSQVNACKAAGGGPACETMRVARSILPRVTANPLTVPYFYQYNNFYEPSATCGLTSAAMLLNYYSKGVTPDGLYTRFGKAQGQSPEGLASIYSQYGLVSRSTRTGTEAMIKRQIDAGRPVVVHGWFTDGHILVIIGYNSTGFVVNDPSGLWAGCYKCGYPNRTSTNGRGITYSYSSMRTAISVDGDIWLSTAGTSAFTL
jgi:uncharacterized protein YvpB